jgi:hypothetical protein
MKQTLSSISLHSEQQVLAYIEIEDSREDFGHLVDAAGQSHSRSRANRK